MTEFIGCPPENEHSQLNIIEFNVQYKILFDKFSLLDYQIFIIKYQMSETKVPTFLMKLKSMLNDEANGHIISWDEKGSKLIIHQIKLFKEIVLPQYFKQPNYSSFQKQMNNYGFKNFRISAKSTEFYNENWTSDYQQIDKIKRRKTEFVLDTDSSFLSQLKILQSSQNQLMENLQHIDYKQRILSQIIYELHLKSQKYLELFQQLLELQL
ncbi:unnamed protein product (macronuclear) [Paramecium tetraurelia]|uniref:HSF-type DNA-binding domain-containing protein n=1 Tax=Paramecium tetraurelia TaxID=5888 RepID=A0BEX6_PARTE|nr:uncharacterized protein GSPATT00028128001 [Paramecium tetraurelia]CAK57093.1 unnamed protein product [Paramecium tetraurelia]|eukprot:XP_001424491.1 hypothetical protein (macronuclear) [Paramecium tetraurelia strain d4-2]